MSSFEKKDHRGGESNDRRRFKDLAKYTCRVDLTDQIMRRNSFRRIGIFRSQERDNSEISRNDEISLSSRCDEQRFSAQVEKPGYQESFFQV